MEPNITINPSTEEIPDANGWYPDRTRRVAVLWINQQDILEAMIQFLTGTTNTHEYELRLTHNCIPKDVKVLNVTIAWDRAAIGFLLSHPSFNPTPEGLAAPDITYRKLVWEYVSKEPTKPLIVFFSIK